MKTIFLATPRSGSHAVASAVDCEINLLEYFNIENLILPRSVDGTTILFDRISKDCLNYLSIGDFKSAWQSQSHCDKLDSVYETNIDFKYTLTANFPLLNEFLNEHRRRWTALKHSNKSWCVKIMKYHYINSELLNDILDEADTIIIIKRKDLVAQAISMIKADHLPSNIWHTTDDNVYTKITVKHFPYDTVVPIIESIINENLIYKSMTHHYADKTKILYYEDVDMHNSKYKKMTVDLQFDIDKCYSLAKEMGHDYSSHDV